MESMQGEQFSTYFLLNVGINVHDVVLSWKEILIIEILSIENLTWAGFERASSGFRTATPPGEPIESTRTVYLF